MDKISTKPAFYREAVTVNVPVGATRLHKVTTVSTQLTRVALYCVGESLMVSGVEGSFPGFIYTTRHKAETLYFSLSGVDALLGEGLRRVFCSIWARVGYNFSSGVDSAAETLSGQGLSDELPTDWVKSD
ncbi:MAG: hypothetical protein ACLFT9_22490 [Coleofasciculus sp.]